jgi:uncharacterized membrane protein
LTHHILERNESFLLRLTKVIGLLFLLSLLLSVQPAYAAERSFQIGEVEIHARVDSDGDMHVDEEDTYHFDGAFNGIIVELDSSKSDGIEDFQAFEVSGQQQISLRSELSSDGDKLQYKVYSQSENESKVFRFTYTVKNVVQVYADTAELYWKFFDERNPTTLETVNIGVELPAGVEREEITAFGHGPSQGVTQIEDNGVVRYQVSPLPSKKLLEVRILFPGTYVPGSMRISADAMLDAIKEEEQNGADKGDDRSVYGALALLIINLAGGIYFKFGRTFKPEWKGKYYRELPSDVTPAVIGYVMKYRVKPRDLMATMVDLVRKKRVSMQMVKGGEGKQNQKDYIFQLLDNREDGLQPHEMILIDWFFKEMGQQNKVSLAEIRKYTQSRVTAEAFTKRWSKWQDEVAQSVSRLGFIENQKWVRRMIQYTAVIQFFGFLFFASENWNWLMFCAIPLIFLVPKSKRRTRAGQTEYVKWKAFKCFLRDYSQIASREPLAVHLWEHFLVYAIPLGVAKKMISITRLGVPGAEQNHQYMDGTYFYHYELWTESFEKTIKTASESSSSSGDSGSFSSGGGDGGGGGGRGAF